MCYESWLPFLRCAALLIAAASSSDNSSDAEKSEAGGGGGGGSGVLSGGEATCGGDGEVRNGRCVFVFKGMDKIWYFCFPLLFRF